MRKYGFLSKCLVDVPGHDVVPEEDREVAGHKLNKYRRIDLFLGPLLQMPFQKLEKLNQKKASEETG